MSLEVFNKHQTRLYNSTSEVAGIKLYQNSAAATAEYAKAKASAQPVDVEIRNATGMDIATNGMPQRMVF